MITNHRCILFAVYFLGLLSLAVSPKPVGARHLDIKRQTGSPYDVIAAVNALRSANGLPPYKVNNSLMAAAQAHSEYQASIGSLTHNGANGSSPKGRAVAAGYGGGKTVFVSENIAMGLNMSAQGAVNIWQGDNLHLMTMLSFSYQDAGVGVATDGDIVYYTLDAGNISGSAPVQPPAGSTQISPSGAAPTRTVLASEFIQPVIVASPLPDGSIIHVVQSGQFLITIAEMYAITLKELLSLNSLTEKSVIYPGDRLLIRPAQLTPTSTPAAPAITKTVQLELKPTLTVTPSPTRVEPAASPTPTTQSNLQKQQDSLLDPLMLAVIILVVVGLVFVVAGSLLKRNV